jgi:glycerol kinase
VSAELVLGIDQGTTSTRAVAFDTDLRPVAQASRLLETRHPQPGWVELEPRAIRDSVIEVVEEVLRAVGGASTVEAAGLANQGETVVAWDATTLEPLGPAVVWQCHRSAPIVERLRDAGLEPAIRDLTGLPLDPYFSAGKLRWLLEHDRVIADAAAAGRLRFGTVDAWITASLGDRGPAGLTDPSTASRTQLYGLASGRWEPELLEWFGVDAATLPVIVDTVADAGTLHHPSWDGPVRLTALACDQQAALAGHGAFRRGRVKATYGTGVFVLANAGDDASGRARLETSVAWSLPDGRRDLVLQGGEYAAGALLDWLRDDLRLIDDVALTGAMASSVEDTAGVVVLPALAGLGAPWYRPDARAAIAGLTAAATQAHVVRATLDAIAHRVVDIVDAMASVIGEPVSELRVDGGLTRNAFLMQRQADLLGVPVAVASVEETTAFGVAALASVGAGRRDLAAIEACNPPRATYVPAIDGARRVSERAAWRHTVAWLAGPGDRAPA